jgi:hypothetical protein
MGYREAVSHGNKCEYNRYECRFKCGAKFLGLEMKDHLLECNKAYTECDGCLVKIY